MRILYARNLFRPVDFGGNRYPLEVTTRLARRGHDVTVITGRFAGPSGTEAVRVVQYPVSRQNPLLTFWTNTLGSRVAIGRAVAEQDPDVVVHSSYDVAYGCWLLPLRHVPSVFIYHSSFHSEAVRRLAAGNPAARAAHLAASAFIAHVERAVLGSVERIVAVSPFSEREIAEHAPHARQRTSVIPTGVDTERFSPGDRLAARARLGIAVDALVLVTVGRLVPVKHYDRAVRAVARLRSDGVAAALILVGDGPERAPLARLAEELGLAGAVRFDGYRDGAELVERLRAADLQLCTSEFENWSLALLEGLACGLPVLGTPFGGTPELLAPVGADLVLPNADPDALAARVADLARDRARLAALGHNARRYALSFGWDEVASRLEAVLQEVSAGSS